MPPFTPAWRLGTHQSPGAFQLWLRKLPWHQPLHRRVLFLTRFGSCILGLTQTKDSRWLFLAVPAMPNTVHRPTQGLPWSHVLMETACQLDISTPPPPHPPSYTATMTPLQYLLKIMYGMPTWNTFAWSTTTSKNLSPTRKSLSSESAPLTIWLISLPNHSTTLTSLSYATLLGSGFHLAPMLPHEEEHYLCPLSSTLRYHLHQETYVYLLAPCTRSKMSKVHKVKS